MLECTLWTGGVHGGISSSSARQPSFHRELLRKSPGHPELGGGWEQAEGGGAHPGAAGGTDPPAHTLQAPGLKPGRGWLPCRLPDLEETEPGTPLGILKTRICEESYCFFLRTGGARRKETGKASRRDLRDLREERMLLNQRREVEARLRKRRSLVTRLAGHAGHCSARPVSLAGREALPRLRAGAPGTWGSPAPPSPGCSRTC